jgi:hypothetical protein
LSTSYKRPGLNKIRYKWDAEKEERSLHMPAVLHEKTASNVIKLIMENIALAINTEQQLRCDMCLSSCTVDVVSWSLLEPEVKDSTVSLWRVRDEVPAHGNLEVCE